jgi:hypothetical protein
MGGNSGSTDTITGDRTDYVAAASDQAQANIDMAAIVVQVEKTCAQQTSQTLASAVWTTILDHLKGNYAPR